MTNSGYGKSISTRGVDLLPEHLPYVAKGLRTMNEDHITLKLRYHNKDSVAQEFLYHNKGNRTLNA